VTKGDGAQFCVPAMAMRTEYRKTIRGVEKIIPVGASVEPIQEIIHYQRRNHRIQVRYVDPKGEETIAWVSRRMVSVIW